MRRQQTQAERPKGFLYRISYGLIVVLVICGWVYAFKSYFDYYERVHPDITWAVPWVQVDVIPVDGILLWNEIMVTSPRDGSVNYPSGPGPVRVPKGASVAKISSGSAISEVKAKEEGYFIAGLDGAEDGWRYSILWPGTTELPAPAPVTVFKDPSGVKKGAVIGKIIPQPQELRMIGYVDMTEAMAKNLAANRIMVKMDPLDTPSRAYVRVYETIGHRAKIYLDIPWFPPEVLLSRRYSLLVETGETSGAAVPESAVTMKEGRRGVYVLRGSEAVFVEIKGRIIDGSRFLATEGLKLGDAVIVDGYGAREGKVRLW
ncbi:MAG: efflux RND transporter periplasmic adaptor subunit [Synergistaceae bacterium]|jgi:hypothetical protein|nr:efflux RND transporter periplasmic adaptor subunit [Synergistaceae bacterium]